MSAAVLLTNLAGLFGASALGEEGAADGTAELRGLWPLPRKDVGNTGRVDLPGNFKTAPIEVWSYGSTQSAYGCLRPVKVASKPAYLVQAGGSLELVQPDGNRLWKRQAIGVGTIVDVLDFPAPDRSAVLITIGNNSLALIDVATGRTFWTWATPSGSMLGGGYKLWKRPDRPRLVVFPQNSVEGFCFELADSKDEAPRLLWQKNFAGRYHAGYGPSIVLADMSKCGKPDILLAGKPAYMAVIDIDTGAIKFDLAYTIPGEDQLGRPYGLLQAIDLDGDGYLDAVMISCQVEEYIAVLHNEKGKGFRLAWSRFIEHDLPNDFYELRPNITSFVDLRGDGKLQFATGLYNLDNDHRWHTVVFDALGGWDKRLADLPDRYFWGCYDLDGDGRPEIITSTEKSRQFGKVATVQAVDGRKFKDIAVVNGVSLSTAARPLLENTAFLANRRTPLYLTLPNSDRGLLMRRVEDAEGEALWRLAKGQSVFQPFRATPTARLALLSNASERVESLDISLPAVDKPSSPAATGPLISRAGGKPEILFTLADGTIIGGAPDYAHPDHFQSVWKVRGTMPAVWIGPQGARIVCALDPEKDSVRLFSPKAGTERDCAVQEALREITLPISPMRQWGSGTADTLLPFGKDSLRLYVGLQTGTHTMASALYDAAGKQIWLDEKEGPYPRRAAVADLEGNGDSTLIVDNHGKHLLYNHEGRKRVIAHGWNTSVPGRADGAKYALPIVGPFGPAGQQRIVMSPGLDALEILDAAGARLARSPYGSTYQREWCNSAVAQLRGPGNWDIGMITHEGVFHCADLATGKDRWTLDLGVKASYPAHIVSGDLDGDGRDNFLVGLANGELVALDEKDDRGAVMWKIRMEAAIRDVILGDVDGDRQIEIVVETDDGRIRVLKPARKGP
jgi:hypothetical protein